MIPSHFCSYSCSVQMVNITPWQRPSLTLLNEVSAVSSTTSQVSLKNSANVRNDTNTGPCGGKCDWNDVKHYFDFFRNLQSSDAGLVHSDLFLPGVLDLWPGSVCWSLYPISTNRSSLGPIVWNTPVLHQLRRQGWQIFTSSHSRTENMSD